MTKSAALAFHVVIAQSGTYGHHDVSEAVHLADVGWRRSTKPQDTMHVVAKALAATFVCSGIAAASAAEPVIGSVMRCEGKCVEISGATSKPLAGRDPVRLMERVSTGADSRLEVGCRDGTRLTLGEKANVVLDAFVYDPNGRNRFHATVTGAFRYVSGKLGAGATRQASISTSIAEIGVRGTDFWGGTLNGVTGVVVFEGVVSVTTAAGSVVLSKPAEGTNLSSSEVAPTQVTRWSPERIAAAVASVAFH